MGSGLAGGGSVGSRRASCEVCCAGDIECNAYLSESHSVVCSTHTHIFFPAPHSGARLSRTVEAVLSGPSRLCHLGRCAGVPAFSLLFFFFFSLCATSYCHKADTSVALRITRWTHLCLAFHRRSLCVRIELNSPQSVYRECGFTELCHWAQVHPSAARIVYRLVP